MSFKVLIVDDEPDLEVLIRQRFRKKIKDGEFEFFFARNGAEALNIVEGDPTVDMVMSDINMPVMDGLTLLSRLADVNRILKTVIVSAYGDMENIRAAMNRGAYDFLVKPIDFQDLEVTLNRTIQELEGIKKGLRAREELAAIHHELAVAARIQQSMLPKPPSMYSDRTDLEIHAEMLRATEVGGDFYDHFAIGKNALGFVVGDVSGRGVAAAIFMAVCRTLLRATAVQDVSPGQCLQYVNDVLTRQSETPLCATIFYGILQTNTGELQYGIAGHNRPFIISQSGSLRTLNEPAGMMAGAFETAKFETGRTRLEKGDCLFVFTNGIIEAVDDKENAFSEARLCRLLECCGGSSAKETVGHVIEEIRRFGGTSAQRDDVTAMALKYIGMQ